MNKTDKTTTKKESDFANVGNFADFTRKLMSVPKSEIDEQAAKYEAKKQVKKQVKKNQAK